MRRLNPRHCRAREIRTRQVPDAPKLRYKINEAAHVLGISRTQLYARIREKKIFKQKDGATSFITHAELERYVASLNAPRPAADAPDAP